jgi:preprotein translocase subunit SecA
MFKLFGTLLSNPNQKFLKKISHFVSEINNLEPQIKEMSDDELRCETRKLKEMVAGGVTLDSLLTKAFAIVREGSVRVFNKRHYDVQLLGGIVLHKGVIAEMRTGEGKTLVATLPAYLNALTGKGVHIVTTNDYLVTRDAESMGKLYNFLGLSLGKIVNGMSDEEKKNAYMADITYGANNEFGFDFLRDNLKFERSAMMQREFNYAIVDEVDSVLIDEARTPLIISGRTNDDPALYGHINLIIDKLKKDDYELDEKARSVLLTEAGQNSLEATLKSMKVIDDESSLYDIENITVLHHIEQSLKAHSLFKKDVDYIVKNGQVQLIDEHTGRIMDGRRYSDGLHQAIEAKEMVKIQNENQTIASITFQNYFRMYPKLSGMTGTAMSEATEFAEIYGLQVISIPTNVPMKCIYQDDAVYRTGAEKYKAILDEIRAAHKKGQPVLVGTTSVEKSEYISSLLKKDKIKHNVLNAKHNDSEAEIIAQAGKAEAVTIATNMAGRGTDIILGGNPEMLTNKIIREKHRKLPEEDKVLYNEVFTELKKEAQRDQAIVKQAGGLLVIGTERHESRRIDNQLRGRSGRQGDPGRTKFFLSMEDDLMRLFGSEKMSAWLGKLGMKEGEEISHPWVSKSLAKAQQKVEARNYEIRKNLLQYDDVMNEQRKVMYSKRNELLEHREELVPWLKRLCNEKVEHSVGVFVIEQDIEALDREIYRIFSINELIAEYVAANGEVDKKQKKQLIGFIDGKLYEILDRKVEMIGLDDLNTIIQNIALMNLDFLWKEHLHHLDQVKMGINLRSYGQKNPLIEYKNEAFAAFKTMLEVFEEQLIERVFRLTIVSDKGVNNLKTHDIRDDTQNKIQRNQLCHCGSGKRYKHCHGMIA